MPLSPLAPPLMRHPRRRRSEESEEFSSRESARSWRIPALVTAGLLVVALGGVGLVLALRGDVRAGR
jgi:hypothetical protein